MDRRTILVVLICAVAIASSVGYYLLPKEGAPLVQHVESTTAKSRTTLEEIHVELDATANLDALPFEVRWTLHVTGGAPHYRIELPAEVISLANAGSVSGTLLFNTNREPWEIKITVKDGQGQEVIARTFVENTILARSTMLLDGTKLAGNSMSYTWMQVHNPDRYAWYEYVTGNEARIDSPNSAKPNVRFDWPGLYRFSLRALGSNLQQVPVSPNSQHLDVQRPVAVQLQICFRVSQCGRHWIHNKVFTVPQYHS